MSLNFTANLEVAGFFLRVWKKTEVYKLKNYYAAQIKMTDVIQVFIYG